MKCFIAATILAPSVVEAPVPSPFEAEPNPAKSSNIEHTITKGVYTYRYYEDKTDRDSLSDQDFDQNSWYTAIESEASSTGDASSLEPPLLEDTQMGGATAMAETSEGSLRSPGNSWQRYKLWIVGAIVIVCLLLGSCVFFLFLLTSTKRNQKKKREKDTLKMFSYMSKFNAEDMDIRRSSAGGFHVAYLNGLANNTSSSLADYDYDDEEKSEERKSSALSTLV